MVELRRIELLTSAVRLQLIAAKTPYFRDFVMGAGMGWTVNMAESRVKNTGVAPEMICEGAGGGAGPFRRV